MNKRKINELLDYIVDHGTDDYLRALEQIIEEAACDGILFECGECREIYTLDDEAVTERRGKECLGCSEGYSIADSDESDYRSAKGYHPIIFRK